MIPTIFNYKLLFILLAASILGTSCVSQKEVTYFQSDSLADPALSNVITPYIAKIQKGDILSVMVSSLSPEASAMFNPYQSMNIGVQNQSQQAAFAPANGYLIDEDGSLTLPLIGKLKIAGLSTTEATSLITQNLDKYLQQPTVNIRILNFKVSVMGEVNRPSVYTIPNEKITLPEALSLAGDLTIYGKRNNIMVIRESEGKREFARIDISKRDFFTSPYYYLHANDVVYVEPTKGRITSSDRAVQLAPIVLSGLSFITLIILNVIR
ncbi:polysaccharide biosynthesis/export family protein [Daejeonella oryzae]|uniref:polysaccharide biosynthesis/export family protein n=1 Tax=Daejeonella oryzae TaxID=1122943 RepID=UPI00041689FB|nr:polysaccharide biosynthesis/export family protein [Daejeonella oryzae]